MKGITKNGAVVVAVLLLVAYFGLSQSGIRLPFAVGWTTLSISQTDVVSSEPHLNGPAYKLTILATGGGESATGSLAAGTILTDGTKANKLDLTLSGTDSSCYYYLNPTTNKLRTITPLKTTFSHILASERQAAAEKWCYADNAGTWLYTQGQLFPPQTFECYKWEDGYLIGTLAAPDLKWTANLQLSLNGKTYSGVIGSQATAVNLQNIVYAQYDASTIKKYCPGSDSVYALYQAGSGWAAYDRTAVTNYLSAADTNAIQSCLASALQFANQEQARLDCINHVNSLASTVIRLKNSAWSQDTGLNAGAALKVDNTDFFYPLITAWVKASELSIVVPALAKPVLSNCRQEGANGPAKADLRSDGEYLYATVELSCNQPISSGGSFDIGVDKGATVPVSIWAGAAANTNPTCQLTAKNKNDPSKTASCSLTMAFTQPAPTPSPCSAGESRCADGLCRALCQVPTTTVGGGIDPLVALAVIVVAAAGAFMLAKGGRRK